MFKPISRVKILQVYLLLGRIESKMQTCQGLMNITVSYCMQYTVLEFQYFCLLCELSMQSSENLGDKEDCMFDP
jgi:hypothetical protein